MRHYRNEIGVDLFLPVSKASILLSLIKGDEEIEMGYESQYLLDSFYCLIR